MSSIVSDEIIELIIMYFIRIHFEKKFKQYVPMAIKNLIFLFSKNGSIGSKLLNFSQNLNLLQLLREYIAGIIGFKLLYRASEHQFTAKSFHENCVGMDKLGQIVIIKSNHDTIFGGYTSKDWARIPTELTDDDEEFDHTLSLWSAFEDRITRYTDDKFAFLYLVKSDKEEFDKQCPMYFPIKRDQTNFAIGVDYNCGPIFGNGKDIYIADKCNKKRKVEDTKYPIDDISRNHTYFAAYDGDTQAIVLCGGEKNWIGYWDDEEQEMNPYGLSGKFDVIEYEVFHVIVKD